MERFKGVNIIIISGSQIAGAFDFRARVDFVKIPSVIKLYNGEYASIGGVASGGVSSTQEAVMS